MAPDTGRLEAFSDGVFAIAATLLVLEFTVNSRADDLGAQLLHIWPAYLAYVTSFATIGIIWMNHHHTVSLLRRVDRTMLFLNVLLLLSIAFLPFPTKLVGDDLRHGVNEEAAALDYTATLLLMAVMHQFWWQYARRGRRLIRADVPDSSLRAVDRAYAAGVPTYGVAFAVAFFSPLAAVFLTLGIAAFYLPSAALFDR
ncbi:MAG: TMEM175 family protein [Gaiellaceae bacterium]